MDRNPEGQPLQPRSRAANYTPRALRYSARLMRFLAHVTLRTYLEEDPTSTDGCILQVDGVRTKIRFLDGSVFVEGLAPRAIPKHTAGRAAVRQLYEDILALDRKKKAWTEELRRQREEGQARIRSNQEIAAAVQRVKAFYLRRFESLREARRIPHHAVEFTVSTPGVATLSLHGCDLSAADAILECLQANKLLPTVK